ncbi:MAG: hypothetical protein H0U74_17235 [Bradymonadaceae bacterium]|nr:hypothetical protein [Lujinxingiaceae bacterium]
MTFLSWRLRDEAALEDIEFEIYLNFDFVRLDLSKAPYAAEPYPCDRNYVCFQYQLPGRYNFPSDLAPIRSVHARHGVFPGSEARRHQAHQTFGVRPIAVENNSRLDARRQDWFADNKIPLKRGYQWQLVGRGSDTDPCAEPRSNWLELGARSALAEGWTSGAWCVAARPKRDDNAGVIVKVPFKPSAELFWESQDYVPPEQTHATVYLFLVDLQISNAQRCKQVTDKIVGTASASLNARGSNVVRAGIYTPISADTGDSTDGCTQRARQDYPVSKMAEDIKNAAARFAPERVRVVLVYLNNMELPPSERLILQLYDFANQMYQTDELVPYSWLIGSNTLMGLAPWEWSTGWRPIEDESFLADLKAFATYNVPFRTMDHDRFTQVPIRRPEGATRPQFFKICDATPQISHLVISGLAVRASGSVYHWPGDGALDYRVELEPQEFVAHVEYRRQRVVVVVEICERFCDGPYRTRSGVDYDNWQQSQVCQWTR